MIKKTISNIQEWEEQILDGSKKWYFGNYDCYKTITKNNIMCMIEKVDNKFIENNERREIKSALLSQVLNIYGVHTCICCRGTTNGIKYILYDYVHCFKSHKVRITEILEILFDQYELGEISTVYVYEPISLIVSLCADIDLYNDLYSEIIIYKLLNYAVNEINIIEDLNLNLYSFPVILINCFQYLQLSGLILLNRLHEINDFSQVKRSVDLLKLMSPSNSKLKPIVKYIIETKN